MKVAVIGGGFAGLMFASKLLESGLDVTLFEEHSLVGYPPHCTGLVSARVVELIGRPAFKSIVARFDELLLSNGRSHVRLRVRGGVYKLDRVKLERLMLEEAISRGLRALTGVRVKRVSPRGVVEAGDVYSFDSIVLADGYHGFLHRSLNMGYKGSPVYGVNVEYNMESERSLVVLFDERIARGFFAWLVGLNDRLVAGLGVRDPRELARSLRSLEVKLGLKKRVAAYGGPVITGPPGDMLSLGKIHVVGDAGGLNKPLTGGGLYPNSLASTLALGMIRRSVEVNKALKTSIGLVAGLLRKQYRLAKVILESGVSSRAIEVASKTEIGRKLGEVDYDHHEQVVSLILTRAPVTGFRVAVETITSNPELLKHIIKAFIPL